MMDKRNKNNFRQYFLVRNDAQRNKMMGSSDLCLLLSQLVHPFSATSRSKRHKKKRSRLRVWVGCSYLAGFFIYLFIYFFYGSMKKFNQLSKKKKKILSNIKHKSSCKIS